MVQGRLSNKLGRSAALLSATGLHALLLLALIGSRRDDAALAAGPPVSAIELGLAARPSTAPSPARDAEPASPPLASSRGGEVANTDRATPSSSPSTQAAKPVEAQAVAIQDTVALQTAAGARPTQPVCGVAAAVQAALQDSAGARLAASGWPKSSLAGISGGSALVFWDGRWIEGDSLGGGDTLQPVRQAINAVLLAASAECLDQLQLGPLAFVIPSGSDPHIGHAFTLGAGVWRWSDLLQSHAQIASLAPPGPAPPAELAP